MTRTPGEVVKPLPGQMAFGFMHAESGPAECLEPEQEGPAVVPIGAAGPGSPGAGIRGRARGPDGRGPPGAMMPSVPTRNRPGTFGRRGA